MTFYNKYWLLSLKTHTFIVYNSQLSGYSTDGYSWLLSVTLNIYYSTAFIKNQFLFYKVWIKAAEKRLSMSSFQKFFILTDILNYQSTGDIFKNARPEQAGHQSLGEVHGRHEPHPETDAVLHPRKKN